MAIISVSEAACKCINGGAVYEYDSRYMSRLPPVPLNENVEILNAISDGESNDGAGYRVIANETNPG